MPLLISKLKIRLYYMKTYFMAIHVKQNPFSKLFIGMIILMTVCMFSCTNGGTKEDKKDTTGVAADTAMKVDTSTKVKADTTKADTTGKGGQPTPNGH
jgi:hypothetical protein